jgi:hypothetical protein
MDKEAKNNPTSVTDEMKAKIKKFTKTALVNAGVKVDESPKKKKHKHEPK